MKLRYMIDSIIADRQATAPEYIPVGVWVQGPGPGLDVEMYYLDQGPSGLSDRKDEAAWVVNRLVEAGVTSLPAAFVHRLLFLTITMEKPAFVIFIYKQRMYHTQHYFSCHAEFFLYFTLCIPST